MRAVDHVDLAVSARRGRRSRRRVGMRQVDARPARGRTAAAVGRRALLARHAARQARASDARKQQLKLQMIFQDPYASLNPRMRVVDIVGEAPVAHRLIGARAAPRVRRDDAQSRRARSDADAPVSAPVLGRPARAHRHRARARGEAGISRLRRIGRRARRVDPGAGAEPVHGSQGGAEPHLSLHQPRSRRRAVPVRSRRRHVPRARSSRPRPTPALFAAPSHPYTQALLAEVGRVEPKKRTYVPIKGEIPSPLDPPPGMSLPSTLSVRDAALP